MDFSAFSGGMKEVWKNAKLAKEAMMDLAKSDVAYGYITANFKSQFENYKTLYQSKDTPQSEKDAISGLANVLLDNYSQITTSKVNNTLDAFITELKSAQPNLPINTDEAGRELAKKLLNDASVIIAADDEEQKEKDAAEWKVVEDKIQKLVNKRKGVENKLTGGTPMSSGRYITNKDREVVDEINKQINELYEDNLELAFRNIMYKKSASEYQDLMTIVQNAEQTKEALEKVKQDFNGWSSGENDKEEEKSLLGSVQRLKDDISELTKLRDNTVFGSDIWKEHTEQLKLYNEELERLLMLISIYENGSKDPLTAMKDVKVAEPKGSKPKIEMPEKLNTPEGFTKMGVSLVPPEWFETVEQLTDRISKMNIECSAAVNLFYSLSDAMRASDSSAVQTLANFTDMAGMVTTGIMDFINIQQACAAATGVTNAAQMPYPYSLAAIASIMTTIISTFTSIKQMAGGKFAEGGIVGGTSYSGDKLFAMVNSGEMILNKRQQSNLNNMLTSNGGGQVEFHISGDTLVGVLNNRQRKTNLVR